MSFLVLFSSICLLLASVTPYIKVSRQETDLPSHFVLQYFIAGCFFALLAGTFDAPAIACVMIFASLLLNIIQMVPLLGFGSNDTEAETGATFKILQVNVLKYNTDPSKLKALIEKEDPDLIVAAEVREPFCKMLDELRFKYPYQMQEPREKARYGMAVASKLGLTSQEHLALGGPDTLSMAFRLMHDGREISFLSMHPATPNTNIAARDREFAEAVKHFGARRGDIVIVGDLNATPYCPALKKLCRSLNLRNARERHGIGGSFPVFLKVPFMRLPIDHVLAGENLHAHGFRLGPDIGSDHYPTITTLSHINH